jgi:hypothetical protein
MRTVAEDTDEEEILNFETLVAIDRAVQLGLGAIQLLKLNFYGMA